MAFSKKLQSLLEKNKIKYQAVTHKTVYTAFDMAQTMKAKMQEVIKTILIKADKTYVLVVLPASRMLDFKKLGKALKAKKVEIAKEVVMLKSYKVKPGSMTPFGKLYDLPVYADKALSKAKKVVARAGSFEDSVVLSAKDLLKLSEATLVDVGAVMKKAAKKAKKITKKKA